MISLSPERIAAFLAFAQDSLIYSGRVEEDELWETGIALATEYEALLADGTIEARKAGAK